MSFRYNRMAFRSPIIAPSEPCPALLRAYISLVAIELFLKDHLPAYIQNVPATHDVPKMLKILALNMDAKYKGAFSSMATQLSTKLSNLWCSSKDGSATAVPSANYPYIRYMRHSNDWQSSASTDADLDGLIAVSNQIMHAIFKATGEKI